jgi:hypothetical protein
MRIVQWSGLSAVVKVKTSKDVTVAIPEGLPRNDVLDLASLILSNREYRQLRNAITPASPAGPNADAGLRRP